MNTDSIKYILTAVHVEYFEWSYSLEEKEVTEIIVLEEMLPYSPFKAYKKLLKEAYSQIKQFGIPSFYQLDNDWSGLSNQQTKVFHQWFSIDSRHISDDLVVFDRKCLLKIASRLGIINIPLGEIENVEQYLLEEILRALT